MRQLSTKYYSNLLIAMFEQWQSDSNVNLLDAINFITEDATPEELVNITADFLNQFNKLYNKYYLHEPREHAFLLLKLANKLVLQLADKQFPIEKLRAYGRKFDNPRACETDDLYYKFCENLSNLKSGSESISTRFINSYEDFYYKLGNKYSLEEDNTSLNAVLIRNAVKLFNIHNILGNKLFDTDISLAELQRYLDSYNPIGKQYLSAINVLYKNAKDLQECATSLVKSAQYLELYDKLRQVESLNVIFVIPINFFNDSAEKPLQFYEKLEALVSSNATVQDVHDFLLVSIRETYNNALKNPSIKKLSQNKFLDEEYAFLHVHNMEQVIEDANYDLIVTMLAIKLHLSNNEVKNTHQKSLDTSFFKRDGFFNKSVEKPINLSIKEPEVENDSEEENEQNFATFMSKMM